MYLSMRGELNCIQCIKGQNVMQDIRVKLELWFLKSQHFPSERKDHELRQKHRVFSPKPTLDEHDNHHTALDL
ncbi:hypothetical protein I7I53_08547 [Histoplasma capsulatum var. duboisii H88]|uniref:Uncharacterized protein n=1 Tax=Ajellomyces capsulatus (strain H88) TaxID=544711 RepID=A0A8A1LJJ0_AJEC8|nr:hypothetical protein I7I53_08547 [Histoplasma capsulatum var. duboisii H88]